MKNYKVKVLSPVNGEMDIVIHSFKQPVVGKTIPITLENHNVEVIAVEELFYEKMNSADYIWRYLQWLCTIMEERGWTVVSNQGFGFTVEKGYHKFSLFGYDSLNKWFRFSNGNKDIINEIISYENTTKSILDVVDFYTNLLEYNKIDTYQLLTPSNEQYFYKNIIVKPYESDPNRF